MIRTDLLRRQHAAASEMVIRIVELIDSYAPDSGDAYRIVTQLAKLNGMLRIHFAQEDHCLYVVMIKSSNPTASCTARAFRSEMGALGDEFEAFMRQWSCSAAIATSFADFRLESWKIFAALDARIERENEQLYPLAEALTDREVRRSA